MNDPKVDAFQLDTSVQERGEPASPKHAHPRFVLWFDRSDGLTSNDNCATKAVSHAFNTEFSVTAPHVLRSQEG